MAESFIFAVAIVFAAGAISGLAGFGLGLVTVPPLLLVYDPATVVVLVKVLALATSWIILLDTWSAIRWRMLRSLLPWAMTGQVVGLVLLARLDPEAVKLLAGAVVVGFAVLLLRGVTIHGADRHRATAIAGAASGTLSTSTGLSGPPIVLLFTLRAYPIADFRATTVVYFIVLDAVALPIILAGGLVGASDLATIALLAPAAFAGRWVGARLARRVSPPAFRRFTLVLLLLTGAFGAAGAVQGLLG